MARRGVTDCCHGGRRYDGWRPDGQSISDSLRSRCRSPAAGCTRWADHTMSPSGIGDSETAIASGRARVGRHGRTHRGSLRRDRLGHQHRGPACAAESVAAGVATQWRDRRRGRARADPQSAGPVRAEARDPSLRRLRVRRLHRPRSDQPMTGGPLEPSRSHRDRHTCRERAARGAVWATPRAETPCGRRRSRARSCDVRLARRRRSVRGTVRPCACRRTGATRWRGRPPDAGRSAARRPLRDPPASAFACYARAHPRSLPPRHKTRHLRRRQGSRAAARHDSPSAARRRGSAGRRPFSGCSACVGLFACLGAHRGWAPSGRRRRCLGRTRGALRTRRRIRSGGPGGPLRRRRRRARRAARPARTRARARRCSGR